MKSKPVVKLSLSADDVVKILEACHKSGVSKLEFSGLRVSMTPDSRTETITSTVLGAPSADMLQAMADIRERGSDQEELRSKETLIDELLIEDPLAYEQLQQQRELEDGKEDN